jgi:chromate reductase
MKQIIAFAGSNSSKSINKQLVEYTTTLLERSKAHVLDLNDFEMPIYSTDREAENGYPEKALDFVNLIRESDGIILSLAEYNGAYSGAFKIFLTGRHVLNPKHS